MAGPCPGPGRHEDRGSQGRRLIGRIGLFGYIAHLGRRVRTKIAIRDARCAAALHTCCSRSWSWRAWAG